MNSAIAAAATLVLIPSQGVWVIEGSSEGSVMNIRFVMFLSIYLLAGILLNICYLVLFPYVLIRDRQRVLFVRMFYLYHRLVSSLFWSTEVGGFPVHECKQPSVFVINHQTIVESLSIFVMSPHICKMVITARFKWIPIVGTMAVFLGMVFVKRSDAKSRAEVTNRSIDCLRHGVSLILAPEGKLSYRREMNPFRLGAFEVAQAAGVPIVPVRNESRLLFEPNHPLRLRRGKLKLFLFEPIDTTGRTPEELRDLVFQQINSISL